MDYFARCWFGKPDARMREFTGYVLEAIFGYNGLYFIEKTDLFIKNRAKYGKGVPSSALDGFRITGDAHEDGVIAHAGAIWSLVNGEPWPEEVYHDHVKRLVRGGSDLTAYVAARLWPARGLIEHVSYRPLAYRIKKGDFTEEDYKNVLKEILMFSYRFKEYNIIPKNLKYKNDFNINIRKIPKYYIKNFGFSHPVCALICIEDIDEEIVKKIRSSLSGGELPIELISALAFLYLHLDIFIKVGGMMQGIYYSESRENVKELFSILDEYFKLEINKNIFSNYIEKIINIEGETLKKFINEFMTIYYISFLESKKVDENLFIKNFKKKFVLAFIDLIGKGERFLENLYFIGESIFEIMDGFGEKYEEIIKNHIISQYKDERSRDFFGRYILKKMWCDSGEYRVKAIRNLLNEFSLYESIFILLNKIEDIYAKDKSIFIYFLAKEIFGENIDEKALKKMREDIINMMDAREGNISYLPTGRLRIVKYGISIYSDMMNCYKYDYKISEKGDVIYNLYDDLLRNMGIIFSNQVNRMPLRNVVHILDLIYLNNFIDEEEKNKKISELIKILQGGLEVMGDLELKQKYLTLLRKKFLLVANDLIVYKDIYYNILNMLEIKTESRVEII